jgi:hypothetical protein
MCSRCAALWVIIACYDFWFVCLKFLNAGLHLGVFMWPELLFLKCICAGTIMYCSLHMCFWRSQMVLVSGFGFLYSSNSCDLFSY